MRAGELFKLMFQDSESMEYDNFYVLYYKLNQDTERMKNILEIAEEYQIDTKDVFKIFYHNDLETYLKEKNSEPSFKNKYFRPKYTPVKDFKEFCENIPEDDMFLIDEVFKTITEENELLIYTSFFGVRNLRRKIHSLDINFVIDQYYFGETKIPDIDYYFLLTHPKFPNFYEKVMLSFEDQDYCYEKCLYMILTTFVKDVDISDESLKIICEKDPSVIVNFIFTETSLGFQKHKPSDNKFFHDLIMKRVERVGKKHVDNYEELKSIDEYSLTIDDLKRETIEMENALFESLRNQV